MAIFEVVEGAPGQGKSLYTAQVALNLLRRNKKWAAKGFPRRQLASNMKFSPQFEHQAAGFLTYWTDTREICEMRDVDILWDEIATELDSRNWQNLTVELKRFLSQYRKRGVDIYANTQDFSMVDARARLMITSVQTLSKIIGSRDLSATKPPPKTVWGLCMRREVENFREINPEKKTYGWVPSFFFITKELVDVYDTRQDIRQGALPPLRHEIRYCEHYGKASGDCSFCKVVHS